MPDLGHVPRQELMHAFDRMIGDPLEDLAQLILEIEPVQFHGLCRPPNYAEPGVFWAGFVVIGM
jgi:hypothetical protein